MIVIYSWNPYKGCIQAQDAVSLGKGTHRPIGPARMLGDTVPCGHDWQPLNAGCVPRTEYDTKHKSYRCAACGARAGRHYRSHRKGWQPTKRWYTQCPTAQRAALAD